MDNLTSIFLVILSLVIFSLAETNLKIFGGEVANIKDVPYMVAIIDQQRIVCGASIINENTVLTAATCTLGYGPGKVVIGYGSSNYSELKLTNVSGFYEHESFMFDYPWPCDISIIKVDPPFVFSDTVQAVMLPEIYTETPEYQKAVLAGWGNFNRSESSRHTLRAINLTISRDQECEDKWKNTETPVDKDEKLCAQADMSDDVRRGLCWGDEGGPLVLDGVQYGIVSYFYDYCGNPNYPPVFTKVSTYINWINDKMDI